MPGTLDEQDLLDRSGTEALAVVYIMPRKAKDALNDDRTACDRK
jgi:hypothetical protein